LIEVAYHVHFLIFGGTKRRIVVFWEGKQLQGLKERERRSENKGSPIEADGGDLGTTKSGEARDVVFH